MIRRIQEVEPTTTTMVGLEELGEISKPRVSNALACQIPPRLFPFTYEDTIETGMLLCSNKIQRISCQPEQLA